MTAKNDITGDQIKSKTNSVKYVNRFDWAFCKDKDHLPKETHEHVHECKSCGMKTYVNGTNVIYGYQE